MFSTSVIVVLVVCTFIQFCYWVGLFRLLAKFKQPIFTQKPTRPVSVIICARNEEHNLSTYLPKVLAQDYPNFEVLVVNDCSTDDTKSVLHILAQSYPQLRILELDTKQTLGKKGALAQGIRAAKYEWLLLTDADCQPLTNQWIANMVAPTQKSGIEIVLGYSPYRLGTGLLNAFIQYETFLTATQYLSYALVGMPYMGVGRNLLYHRSVFEKSGGFKWHEHVISGDDDLLMSKAAKSHNTAICISENAHTLSNPSANYALYYRQKSRHLSSGKFYNRQTKVLLGLFTVSHCFTYLCLFICLIFKISTMFVLCLYVTRLIVVFPMTYLIKKRLRTHTQLVWLPMLDLLLPMYILLMSHALILNPHRWK